MTTRRWRLPRCLLVLALGASLAACSNGDKQHAVTKGDGPGVAASPDASTTEPDAGAPTCPPAPGLMVEPDDARPAGVPPTIAVPKEGAALTFSEATAQPALCGRHSYGRGASLVDLDGDGWDDLYLTDTDSRWKGDEYGTSAFFHNDRGTLRPWDLGIDEADIFMNGGGIFGDFDNDGAPDLLLLNGNNTGESKLALYRNDIAASGTFTSVTEQSGISRDAEAWWGATWGDVDGDGYLDLVVTGLSPHLYRNDGDGTFTDVSVASGLGSEAFVGTLLRNPVLFDADGNGSLDLFVSMFDGPHGSRLLLNDGAGRFRDVTAASGVPEADLQRVWAVAVADFDQDGRLDLWLGRWWFQDLVLLNDGGGHFSAHGSDVGIVTQLGDEQMVQNMNELSSDRDATTGTPAAGSENTMGLNTMDLLPDGYPDVLIGPGDPTRAWPMIAFCARPDTKTRVRFHRCSEPFRSTLGDSRGHGTTGGDIDHDGDLDVVFNPGGFPPYDAKADIDSREPPRLFLGGGEEQAASVRLLVGKPGRSAIGARIQIDGTERHYQSVISSQGFQSQNSDRLLVPTGDQALLTITWPDGEKQVVAVKAGDDLVLRH